VRTRDDSSLQRASLANLPRHGLSSTLRDLACIHSHSRCYAASSEHSFVSRHDWLRACPRLLCCPRCLRCVQFGMPKPDVLTAVPRRRLVIFSPSARSRTAGPV
jgi:hypothetical protein